MILSFGGKSPRDEGAAFVADNATVQGDVLLKPGTTVWYGAVLRGDSGTLTDWREHQHPGQCRPPLRRGRESAAGQERHRGPLRAGARLHRGR